MHGRRIYGAFLLPAKRKYESLLIKSQVFFEENFKNPI